MDGSSRQIIYNMGLNSVRVLALDIFSQTLYWADNGFDRVESLGVDGSNKQVIIQTTINLPFQMDVTHSSIYFTSSLSITRVPRSGGTTTTLPQPITSCSLSFSGIKVVDYQKQPEGEIC